MKILNFGSLNLDSVFQVDHLVRKGETIQARRVDLFPGGKGLNQAVAASQAGSEVWMAGNIGTDGNYLLQTLRKADVHTEFIETLINVNTGRAIIETDPEGENSILYDPGANEYAHIRQILSVLARFRPGDFLLCQNEINNTNLLIDKARKKGMRIFFNPSPMKDNVFDLDLNGLECLVVNETECALLVGDKANSPYDLCRAFLSKNPDSGILLTLGGMGSLYARHGEACFMPAFPVKVKDSTGAGDTYLGYFADGLARGLSIAQTMRRASAAAALAITKKGAASSIPSDKEVDKFLKKNPLEPMLSKL